MKYRVVQLDDGRYQAQKRFGLSIWWVNCVKDPSGDREDQIRFAEACQEMWSPKPKPRPRITSVVWP